MRVLRKRDVVVKVGLSAVHIMRLVKTENFRAAFERAKESGKPAIIELKVDPEAITPSTTLTELRAAATVRTA